MFHGLATFPSGAWLEIGILILCFGRVVAPRNIHRRHSARGTVGEWLSILGGLVVLIIALSFMAVWGAQTAKPYLEQINTALCPRITVDQ